MGEELFHADGQTDRQIDGQADATKLIAAFRNFANEPKREAVQRMYSGQTQYFLLGDSTKHIESKIGCLEKCDTLKFVVIYFMADFMLLIIFLRLSCVFK